jgi:peptide/nickel transport system permease protein
MQSWNEYYNNEWVFGRPIATVGDSTSELEGDYWLTGIDSFTHLLLPTAALMLISVAGYVRYSRASLLEVLNQDYIRTARAKGLNERTVIMRHAFRNSLIPLTTVMAFDFAGVIGGAIITERVFAWRGMGTLFNDGLAAFDLNLVMGVILITSISALLFNLIADLVYAALDPRIRVTK